MRRRSNGHSLGRMEDRRVEWKDGWGFGVKQRSMCEIDYWTEVGKSCIFLNHCTSSKSNNEGIATIIY